MSGGKTLVAIVVLVVVGSALASNDDSTKEQKSATKTVEKVPVAMPNVIGMSADNAKSAIEKSFPKAYVVDDDGGESAQYATDNRCSWTNPDGSYPNRDSWSVTYATVGATYSTRDSLPAEPGAAIDFDRPYFELKIERPSDVWCKPYGTPASTGSINVDAPDVNLPNPDKPWICRKVRWC